MKELYKQAYRHTCVFADGSIHYVEWQFKIDGELRGIICPRCFKVLSIK